MTAQEIFDTVVDHLHRQVFSSAKGNGSCYYRHPDNPTLRCAVGALIPDEMYTPDMENKSVEWMLSGTDGPFTLPDYFQPNLHLLQSLQSCHDVYYVIPDSQTQRFNRRRYQERERKLSLIATRYRLRPYQPSDQLPDQLADQAEDQ